VEVIEGLLQPGEIQSADEMFLTSTTREIVPIVRVKTSSDTWVIANGRPGPVTRALREAYVRELSVLILED
jgi:branched-subunit amino acid aminotransferase/4-amino-4-deoxychorismate lyase